MSAGKNHKGTAGGDANARFSDEMLLMTARLYYIDGLPQADVARIMHVSQPQVSRLLSLARSRGIVRISVADYDPRDRQLEEELSARLNLQNPIVIKTITGAKVRDLRYTVAHFAAADVSRAIAQSKMVALAGGRTLQDLCGQITDPPTKRGLIIVQAMGNVGSMPNHYDALELGRQLAAKFEGSFFMLNTPVLLPTPETCEAIISLEVNQQVVRRYNECDLSIVGVGTLVNSVFSGRDVFEEEELDQIRKQGAVGEICGRFFDKDGVEIPSVFKGRVASISLDQLRKIPRIIAVTVGDDRAAALLAAIRGGLVNSLVIDDGGATALLALAAADREAATSA